MKQIIIFFIVLFSFLNISIIAQNNTDNVDSTKSDKQISRNQNNIDTLNKIYRSLEFDTRGFNDVKEKWLITDRALIRTIFNQYLVNGIFPPKTVSYNNSVETDNSLKIVSINKNISNGSTYIKVTKRYFDDEIEKLEFLSKNDTSSFPEMIDNPYYLKYIVGENIYKQIQNKSLHTEITRIEFNTNKPYNYDIYFNAFEPHLMFWQVSTNNENSKQNEVIYNKYLLSFFGKWGNDYTVIPGWFASDYIGGLKINYKKNVLNHEETYSIALGTNLKGGTPFPSEMPQKALLFSGRSLYFNLEGINFLGKDIDNLKFTFEGKIRLQTYNKKQYQLKGWNCQDFFTIKNYFIISLKRFNWGNKEIFNSFELENFELGGGISLVDVSHLKFIPGKTKVLNLDQQQNFWNRSKIHMFLDLGFNNNNEALLTHKINVIINYNLDDNYGYLGLKLRVMLGDTFGFDARIYNKFGISEKDLPLWRNGNYFVFSPIIRIRY